MLTFKRPIQFAQTEEEYQAKADKLRKEAAMRAYGDLVKRLQEMNDHTDSYLAHYGYKSHALPTGKLASAMHDALYSPTGIVIKSRKNPSSLYHSDIPAILASLHGERNDLKGMGVITGAASVANKVQIPIPVANVYGLKLEDWLDSLRNRTEDGQSNHKASSTYDGKYFKLEDIPDHIVWPYGRQVPLTPEIHKVALNAVRNPGVKMWDLLELMRDHGIDTERLEKLADVHPSWRTPQ